MPTAPALSPIESPVWILRGLGHAPARLRLHRGRLRLSGPDGAGFDVALADATVRKPWWWFGGGFHIVVDGTTHKVSFVRPNGAAAHGSRAATNALGTAAGPLVALRAGGKAHEIRRGRADVARWSRRLTREGIPGL